MKKVVIFAFAICLTLASKAQQDIQMTHFMFDKMSFNPGAIGSKDAWCLTAINRRQWTGFDAGEPSTTLINFSTPNLPIIKGAVGLTYFNDQIGWETNNVIRLGYSLNFSEIGLDNLGPGDLSLGLSVGYNTKRINALWVTPDGIPPGSVAGTDNTIPTSNVSDGGLSFNAGLYYQTSTWYAGVSTTNLSESELQTLKVIGKRHFYGMAGANLPLLGNFELRPNVLLKSDGVKTQYDLNVNVLAYDRVWAGLTYRHLDAIAPMAGLQYKGIQVGYSYGLGTSFLSNFFTNGNHEIMVNYCFKIEVPVKYEREVHPYLL